MYTPCLSVECALRDSRGNVLRHRLFDDADAVAQHGYATYLVKERHVTVPGEVAKPLNKGRRVPDGVWRGFIDSVGEPKGTYEDKWLRPVLDKVGVISDANHVEGGIGMEREAAESPDIIDITDVESVISPLAHASDVSAAGAVPEAPAPVADGSAGESVANAAGDAGTGGDEDEGLPDITDEAGGPSVAGEGADTGSAGAAAGAAAVTGETPAEAPDGAGHETSELAKENRMMLLAAQRALDENRRVIVSMANELKHLRAEVSQLAARLDEVDHRSRRNTSDIRKNSDDVRETRKTAEAANRKATANSHKLELGRGEQATRDLSHVDPAPVIVKRTNVAGALSTKREGEWVASWHRLPEGNPDEYTRALQSIRLFFRTNADSPLAQAKSFRLYTRDLTRNTYRKKDISAQAEWLINRRLGQDPQCRFALDMCDAYLRSYSAFDAGLAIDEDKSIRGAGHAADDLKQALRQNALGSLARTQTGATEVRALARCLGLTAFRRASGIENITSGFDEFVPGLI